MIKTVEGMKSEKATTRQNYCQRALGTQVTRSSTESSSTSETISIERSVPTRLRCSHDADPPTAQRSRARKCTGGVKCIVRPPKGEERNARASPIVHDVVCDVAARDVRKARAHEAKTRLLGRGGAWNADLIAQISAEELVEIGGVVARS